MCSYLSINLLKGEYKFEIILNFPKELQEIATGIKHSRFTLLITSDSNLILVISTRHNQSQPNISVGWAFFLTLDNYAITNYEKYYRRFYSRQFYLPY